MVASTIVTQSSKGSKKGVLDKTWLYRNMHKLHDSNNFPELNASDWWTLTRLIKFANEEKGYVVFERAIDDSQMIQLAQQVGGRLS